MDDSRTVWVGNVSDQATEELLYELFLQAGPLERVRIPTDKEGRQSNFGFVTFKHNVSVPYAVDLLNGLRFFEKSLNIKPRQGGGASRDKPTPIKGYSRSRMEVSRPKDPAREPFVDQQTIFDNLLQMGQMLNVELPDNRNIADYRGGPGYHPGGSFPNDFEHDIEYERDEEERGNNFRNRNRRGRNRPKGGFNRNRERHHDHNRERNNRRERHHESGMGRGGRRNHRF